MSDEIDCDHWSFTGTQAGEVRSQQRNALGQAATHSLAEVSHWPQSTFKAKHRPWCTGSFSACDRVKLTVSKQNYVNSWVERICAHCHCVLTLPLVLCSFPASGERALCGERGLQRARGRAAFLWLPPSSLPHQSGWPPPQSDARATPQGKRLGQAQFWRRSQRG